MTEPQPTVLYHEVGAVGVITFNRPEKLNALNPQVLDDLEAAVDAFEASDVRCGVVTGNGRAFVAGADIGHYVGLTIHQYRDFMVRGRAAHDRLVRSPKILIAAVEGFALGGGFELALCCDLIVAAADARFGLPEVKLGLLPGGGGTQRLSRALGARRTLDLLVTGRFVHADELASWGIVSRVVEKGGALSAATRLADLIAAQAPHAVRLAKRLLRDGADAPLEAALTLEHAETAALYMTEDAREGISAFIEKRPAAFTGR